MIDLETGPTTLKFCDQCQKETPHAIRSCSGATVRICIPCLERAILYEEDRD